MKELIFSITKKDFDITYFNGTGNGGQHRNKHKNCVRLKHLETGIMTVGQSERSLKQNLKRAFKQLVNNEEFKTWLTLKISSVLKEKEDESVLIAKRVDEAMKPENLRIEYLT